MKLLVLLLLAVPARAGDIGGHELVEPAAPAVVEDRAAILDEMWERRILAPDQSAWSPADAELLGKIRAAESDALAYLKANFGGTRPWTAPRRSLEAGRRRLTKEGYEKYLFHLTQDAIKYFEGKGAGAKWALKLTDWDGARLFDGEGRLTPAGAKVYRRAQLKLEVYWRSPDGRTFGTRRPPASRP
ncbi:MAG: hypothetical protein COV48_00060 [Elusimicrobia bacterium CG11_big_fil_rev_8_21_14_0_20_64_6]|nr:MAG: hypothetical protein COV48_00060 [Elusimicrobia bacterium CG11_big_fil_rev_8_21_14_0_20_64_6]